ncbi:helix-turn-helix transcriptional regulator [Pseudonocardia humida]|uniref:Helix-turn-helix domain-containing protein n=1 Tax=Pseudonocardia humida TaxID=2800819 RepID=A0ABT1A937_9PSEU|nr:helix-turn-helix transcriptional regulator [Pseudonocardia humida]MCO1659550.1 helix-turn-helix domain-containing protein [Pseudonocardia humida]
MTAPTTDPVAGNALGAFLRARREATTPAAAGLPAGPRRRTPGLRRGELAELAGVSVEYLTRLERGRDRRPSPQVLAALAAALRLGEDEHVHLIRLVKAVDGGGACAVGPARPVRPGLRALLDRLDPDPALLIDRVGTVLACTGGFRELAGPLGLLDADCIARYVLTDPRARAAFPRWDAVADEWAVRLRAAADLGDARAACLAAELALTPGTGFAARFAAATRVPRWSGRELWAHPERGEVHLGYEALEVPASEEHHLVVYRRVPGC